MRMLSSAVLAILAITTVSAQNITDTTAPTTSTPVTQAVTELSSTSAPTTVSSTVSMTTLAPTSGSSSNSTTSVTQNSTNSSTSATTTTSPSTSAATPGYYDSGMGYADSSNQINQQPTQTNSDGSICTYTYSHYASVHIDQWNINSLQLGNNIISASDAQSICIKATQSNDPLIQLSAGVISALININNGINGGAIQNYLSVAQTILQQYTDSTQLPQSWMVTSIQASSELFSWTYNTKCNNDQTSTLPPTTTNIPPCPTPQPSAHNNCVYTFDRWYTLDTSKWPVHELQLGNNTYDESQVRNILKLNLGTGSTDTTVQLAGQLSAVLLDIAHGAKFNQTVQYYLDEAHAFLLEYPVGSNPTDCTSIQLLRNENIINNLFLYTFGSSGVPQCIDETQAPTGNELAAPQCNQSPYIYIQGQSQCNQTTTCPAENDVCYVIAPSRLESPWKGSNSPYPQCYNTTLYTCTSTNFLCPLTAPIACGEACYTTQSATCSVDTSNWLNSQVVQRNDASKTSGSPSIHNTIGNSMILAVAGGIIAMLM